MSQKTKHEEQQRPLGGNTASFSLNRREFLGGAAGLAAALATGGAVLETVLVPSAAEAVEITPSPPGARLGEAQSIRVQAAADETKLGVFPHPTNGDEERYPNFIGNFSKTLPHNSIGEVDPVAYNALLNALGTGNIDDFENVPIGGTAAYLNPMGGLAFNIEGPDSPATELVATPPAIASAAKAAEAVEIYWQAYLRDVPFADYNVNPVVQQACDDLSRLSDYRGPRDTAGRVTPQLLFRYNYPGCLDGPMTSQILYRDFAYDGIQITPQIRTRQPVLDWNPDGTFTFDPLGRDFLTAFSEWLDIQNGVARGNVSVFDATPRFIRNVRDLGHLAGSDTIYSAYFRAAIVLGGLGAVVDDGNPYKNRTRQGGFATFGLAHLLMLVGSVHKAERHAWYDKWNVHRHLRPEAFGGLVDNHLQRRAQYPLHMELLNSPVLGKIAAYNQHLNQVRFGTNEASFLLPQELPGGSPAHPSAPAGHAVSAGACVTILKAWFNEDTVINPARLVQPNRDGTALEPYSGPPLTIGGELNKLCHNLTAGRDMSGLHWRIADDLTGNFQGEEIAIRVLREAKATYPEPNATFSLTKFNGEKITI